ncbi:hypothetical protein KA005_53775 [bacterium]|nr:hypothetical protein [bacterium]
MVERDIYFVEIPKDQLPRNLNELAMCLGLSGKEVEIYVRSMEAGQSVFISSDEGTNESKIEGIEDFSLDLGDLFKKED